MSQVVITTNRTHNTASKQHFNYPYFDGSIGRGNYRILRRDRQSTYLDEVVMNEKYLYGICHVCEKAVSIPGLEAYYCSSCQKWLTYLECQKVNFSLQKTQKRTRQSQVISDAQLTLTVGGES